MGIGRVQGPQVWGGERRKGAGEKDRRGARVGESGGGQAGGAGERAKGRDGRGRELLVSDRD